MPKRPEFTKSRFILTEGFEDAEFLKALTDARNIADFDVSPTEDVGSTAGNSGFEDAVIACEPLTGFSAVKDIVIIADNDDNPANSFASVCAQILKAQNEGNLKRNWGEAIQPNVKAAGDPSVSIWMWPSTGMDGCLETLLWQVVQNTHPNDATCVDAALKCSGADQWPISKLDKARVRCWISIVCRRNPALRLGHLWRRHLNLLPLNRAEFDPISSFLAAI
ncbi:MAG: hypothetical protein IH905_17310 [Proteobacteria bacterium]|nr:hypothetical protein [Pseudomonadota bacterium]